MAVQVQISTTPNEHALKFTIDRQAIESGHKTFANAQEAAESPVAKALFSLEGVASVFLMADFITVTKKPDANWDNLQSAAVDAIKASFD
jgi:Scaffold protein Nfu/NifU N terminal